MQILGHRHSALIVEDLDRIVKFYSVLGFKETRRDLEEGEFISHMIGVKNAKLDCAKIALPNGYTLELIKYINPVPAKRERILDTEKRYKFGLDHLGFTVDNIEEVLKVIVQQGGRIISLPKLTNPGLPSIHAYVEDPEGNLIHMAENVKSAT
jgi:catechol 2,3-dioxygenase-like lactoylglutathione lyase family enzyme